MARRTFIGNAFISITGDKKGLDAILSVIRKDMQKLGKELQAAGLKLMAVGAAIQAPLTLAVRQFAHLGSEIVHAAERAGVATDVFSELGHVAKISGTDMGALEKALLMMQKNLYGGKSGKALADIGLSMKDLKGKGVGEQFELIADHISRIGDEGSRVGVAMKIFGKGGAAVLPMLDLGAKGIQLYREEARRLGVSLGPESAKKAEHLARMMERLGEAFKGVVIAVGEILAGGFDHLLVYLTNLTVHVREFIQNNPQVITGLQQVAIALMAIGAGLFGLGTAARTLSYLVSPGGVLLALGGILLYISGVLDPVIEKWGQAVMDFEIGGKKVSDWLGIIKDSLSLVWQGTKTMAAQLGPVFKSFWEMMGVGFDSMWKGIYAGFEHFKIFALQTLASIFAEIGKVLGKMAAESTTTAERLKYWGDLRGVRGAHTLTDRDKRGWVAATRAGMQATVEGKNQAEVEKAVRIAGVKGGMTSEYALEFARKHAAEAHAGGWLGRLKQEQMQGFAESFDFMGSQLAQSARGMAPESKRADKEAAAARRDAAAAARTFGANLGEAGAMLQGLGGDLLDQLKGTWGAAFAPMLEMIFGPAGHKDSKAQQKMSLWEQLLNIPAGLGEQFEEIRVKTGGATAGPAMQAALATSGTFSGLSAGFMAAGQSPAIQIAQQQLEELRQIRKGVEDLDVSGGYGSEE